MSIRLSKRRPDVYEQGLKWQTINRAKGAIKSSAGVLKKAKLAK